LIRFLVGTDANASLRTTHQTILIVGMDANDQIL